MKNAEKKNFILKKVYSLADGLSSDHYVPFDHGKQGTQVGTFFLMRSQSAGADQSLRSAIL